MGALTFPLTFGLNSVGKTSFSLTSVAQIYGQLFAGGLSPIFSAPLITTIVPTVALGSPTATYTRASTAYQTDFEGKLNLCLSGEVRFQGARRIYNLCPTSSASISITGNKTITVGVGTYVFSMGAEATASSLITFTGTATGSTGTLTANATKRTAATLTITVAGTIIATCTVAAAADIQFENVTGQANQNPSAYVSVGVLSAPYHGAAVDGVKYFQTLNGNTVASNVVTEATGAQINSSQGACAGGVTAGVVTSTRPLGYLAELAATNLAGFSSDLTQVATWPVVTMTTAFTSTGPDGVANSATRLTATGALATILQVFAAAASSRTYSVWARRVTGTGTIKLFQGATKSSDLASSLNSTTYTKISLTASVDVTVLGFGIEIGTSGDAIDVWVNQFEAGSAATSPIPTPTTASVARVADDLRYVQSGNLSNINGTAYVEVYRVGAVSSSVVIGDSTLDRNIIRINSALTQIITKDGTNTTTWSATVGLNTLLKMVTAWNSATSLFAIYVNGTAATTGTPAFDGDLNISTISIGSFGTVQAANSCIANVRIYSKALSAAQLASMTA